MLSDVTGVLLLSCELVSERCEEFVELCGRTLWNILENEMKRRANMNVFENR